LFLAGYSFFGLTNRAIQEQSDEISASVSKTTYTSGDTIDVIATISPQISRNLKKPVVSWATTSGQSGRLDYGGNENLTITFVAPDVKRPRTEQLVIKLYDSDKFLAERISEMYILPKTASPIEIPIVFYDPLKSIPALEQSLSTRGFQVSHLGNVIDKQALLMTSIFDDQVSRHLQSGGRAVILIDSKDALPDVSPIKVKARSDEPKTRIWVRSDAEPFSEVASDKALGTEATSISPRFYIGSVKKENYDDVMAGDFSYESKDDPTLALQMWAAGGRAFVTTFRFDQYGSDAFATSLLDAIMRYTMSQQFKPHMNWHIREE